MKNNANRNSSVSKLNQEQFVGKITYLCNVILSDHMMIQRLARAEHARNMHLDSRTPQTQIDAPLQEGKTEMAQRKRIQQRVTVGQDEQGHPIQKVVSGYDTQEVIKNAARLLIQEGCIDDTALSTTEKELPCNAPMFIDYMEKWFETYKKPFIKQNHARNYLSVMNKHLKPYFAKMHINEMNTEVLQRFINEKCADDYATSTIDFMLKIISQVLDSAIEDGYSIDKNGCNPAKSKRLKIIKRVKEREPLSAQKVQEIWASLDKLQPNERIIVAIALGAGLRRGEILGLQWQDIDFEQKLIHVHQAITFHNNQPFVDTTKTKAGNRDAVLTADVEKVLLPLKGDGYLLKHTNRDGSITLFTETAYQCAWNRINKVIGLKGVNTHVMRHTFATYAQPHVDVKTLQTMLGHSDISTTMNRYVHANTDRIKEAGKELQGMYQTPSVTERVTA